MPALSRALRLALPALVTLVCLFDARSARAGSQDSAPRPVPRGVRAFQPKPGDAADEPAGQLVQVLLDRQDKGDHESYMVQALFRGRPAGRRVNVRDDRVEIDFLDAGKPAMRLARIRGGALEASSVEEYFYRLPAPKDSSGGAKGRVKRLVRLTLYIKGKPELHFRDTLDRTLIHFRVDKPRPAAR